MPRKRTLGYVQLEWTCPNCSTRNPGPEKTCVNCGAPQPENVQFEQPAERKFVSDEKAAKAGPDIHCGFCGTRNPASAEVCSQCGGDLKEGAKRAAGRLMTPQSAGPKSVACTNCGAENPSVNPMCSNCGAPLPRAAALAEPAPVPAASVAPPSKKKSSRLLWAGLGATVLAACTAILFLFVVPTATVHATVSDVYWQTSVPLQELQTVNYSGERGSPPADAYDVSCDTQSREVCEEKTIDRGNGYAEVVEECHTETEQYCDYSRDEWNTIQTYTQDGHDFSPVYSQPSVISNQRLGDQSVDYTVYFETEKGQKTYTPDELSEFAQFEIGSVWTLRLNALGGVVSVESEGS